MKHFFYPKNVAVVGASRRPHTVGHDIVKNLLDGGVLKTKFNRPYKGRLYLVNPNADQVLGIKCYNSLLKIKNKIDLVIIAVPANIVPKIVKDCIKKRVKAVIIISAGFAETGLGGKELQDHISLLLKKAKIPLLGPNCLGVINTQIMNASFAPTTPPKGKVAFITQSGALADSVVDWAVEQKFGFSKIISVGNSANLDVGDFIDYLAKDKETKTIAIYLEALKNGRGFIKSAQKCKKPIIVLKGGKTENGKTAVSSHTGSLAGNYEIYKAAFHQAKVLLVSSIEELFESARLLAKYKRIKNNIAIITNGGGCGVLAADIFQELEINLAKLSKKTLNKIEGKMHPAYSRKNPLDIVGDASSFKYDAALNAVLSQKNISGIIVLQTLQTMTNPIENAKVIIKASKKFPKKPIISVFMGGTFTKKGKHFLEAHNLPVYNFPKEGGLAIKSLIKK